MKKYVALAGAVALAFAINSGLSSQPAEEELTEYILQGAKKATILKDVESVGGEIIHEYSVIEAISVRLSASQLSAIKKLNPMIRSFKDQSIEVASSIQSFSSDNVTFDLKDKSIVWKGINSSNSFVTIDSLSLSTPRANQRVLSVEVNGQALSASSIGSNDTLALAANEQVELGAGQVIEVKVKFKKLRDTDPANYQIHFTESQDESFAEASSVETVIDDTSKLSNLIVASAESELSKVSGKLKFYAQSNEVNWTVANVKSFDQALSQIKVLYPKANNAITTLSINDTPVSFEQIGGVLSLSTPADVPANTPIQIKLGFDSLASVSTDLYDLEVSFAGGEKESVIVPLKTYAQGSDRDTHFPTLVRANEAHKIGLTGDGVTVAILDTGLRWMREIVDQTDNVSRNITNVSIVDRYHSDETLVLNEEGQLVAPPKLVTSDADDSNGHGTHLASIIANSSRSIDEFGNETGSFNGIAPDVNLVLVKAFDEEGQSSYIDIIKAVEYVVENKDSLNIKVLNLSFSAIPSSYYWEDPLNQALMKAWQAGITVVAAAGNRGPGAMSIGVPGNTPYVITVGAVTDNYTPNDLNDDFVTTFSSAGPTYEGFIKPELVAPGGHIQGLIPNSSLIRTMFPLYNEKGKDSHNYYELSGSSQSTAVTTGIVALMLQANPSLTPDDIKCRLIATARAATNDNGELAFSIFQQGAGLVDAMAAIESTETGCSNAGLSIANDLSGEEHFIGPTRFNEEDGHFYIPGAEGLTWSGVYTDSQLWRNRTFDTDSQLWRNRSFNSDSQVWQHTSFESNSQLWRNRTFSADSQLWLDANFDIDSQLWRNRTFDTDSQLWRNRTFDTDSQLWRNRTFGADSIARDWVDQE